MVRRSTQGDFIMTTNSLATQFGIGLVTFAVSALCILSAAGPVTLIG
jgi:hypothetical protein